MTRQGRINIEALKFDISLLSLLPDDANPRRVGKDEYLALCSFHAEKRPAMKIKLLRGGWYFNCFACNEKGDVFTYYQKTRNVDFRTAVRELGTGRDLSFTPKRRRRPGFVVVCSECPARAEIEANDIVHLMVYRGPDLGWFIEEFRQLCPVCVEKRLSDPYRGGQQTMFRRRAA